MTPTPTPAGRFQALLDKFLFSLQEPQVAEKFSGAAHEGERVDEDAPRRERDEAFYWGWNMYGYW